MHYPFGGYSFSDIRSELKLQSKLNRPRTTDLVKRIQATVRPTGAETIRQRLRRAAKQRAGQNVGGTAEVRVIEDVEKLRAKL